MTHPDVPSEQAQVDRAYERLTEMRSAAETMLQDAFGERGGTFQAVTERDIRVRNSLGRLEHLQIGGESLVFGRIDRTDPRDGGTEAFHIGRLAISDVDQEPLVVDWRAPVAEPFYRATGAHPMGLSRRRHLLTEGRTVLDLEDEFFSPDGDESGATLGLSGPQVLLAHLSRSRTGRMRDIVATVQREQDEIIRGPLPGILVVQGGPGTGKTAVALHRAAYLLYTHRFPLETQGVLVVGPNPTFLRYIEHVLPSLDETGVELSTVTALYSGAKVSASDDDDVARLKGDPRMAHVVAHAVSDRQRPLRHTARIPYGRRVLRLTPELSAQAVTAVKRRAGTHNARRRTLERILWRQLLRQVEGESESPGSAANPAPPGGLDADELGRSLRRVPEMVEALDRMWPLLTPEELLHDLFGAAPLIDLAASKVLTPAERGWLKRDRAAAGADVAWTEADIPLLDEALSLLGARRRSNTDPRHQPVRAFGHVVVDEAQDLSPMELRMVGRRSLSGSLTVVGDIAQATGSWVPSSWSQVIEHLPGRRGWRLVELTVNYRTPAEIMDLAARILERVAPNVRPARSVRTAIRPPRVLTAARSDGSVPLEALMELTAQGVRDELDALRSAGGGGTIGVVAPPSLLDQVGTALTTAGVTFGSAGHGALDETVTLLAIEDAKGLEFDSVAVVEPARIAGENPQGLRSLYVALTRATQSLVIVHSEALPAPLAAAAQHTA
jgi:DNA helicase IV